MLHLPWASPAAGRTWPWRHDASEDLDEVGQAIEAAGRRAVPVAMDVRDLPAIEAGVDVAVQALGGVDILVNNAGVEQVCASLEVEEPLWDRIVDTNLKGAFFCARAAARRMQGEGAILNVCSLTSEVGVPTAVPYGVVQGGPARA